MAKKTTKANKGNSSSDERLSKLTVDPSVQSAVTVKLYGIDKDFRDTNIFCLADVLSEQIKATNSNDLANLEGMLTGQAYALNAIFNRLTQIASWNIDDHLKGAEILLKLGLRAQSQCRSTIEAISTVKNPPVMGNVKQANITQGPQQINNGTEQGNTSRAGEKQNPKNELLEAQDDGEWLDTGKTSETSGNNPELETVGMLNRAKD